LLHTHGHTDHAGSTRALKQRLRVPAAVHAADAPKMRAGDSSPLVPLRFSSRVLSLFLDPKFPPVEPDLLIDEGYSLAEFGLPAAVVHTPGHTPGSISVLFEDGRAIAGDLMMGGSFGGAVHPFDPGYHYFAEDLAELRRSIRKLLNRGAKTIYLGHGGPLDAERVRERFAADFAGL
jgi:glyoxylase-like metal-dependent hydrolase (beta-lactamase superfamily II)